ncbi:MAG: thioredoxin family protein [Bacteroidales bacterium]|nr:thioredoxin family protein [Bacteroidales bacterium]
MKYLIPCFVLFYLKTFAQFNNYNFTLTLPKYTNIPIYFGYHYFGEQFIIDTLYLNEHNKVVKKVDSLHEGMYFVVLGENKYFNFILGKNTTINVFVDTSDILNSLKFENDLENYLFTEYQKCLKKMANVKEEKKKAYEQDSIRKYLYKIEERIFTELDKNSFLHKLVSAINKDKYFTLNAKEYFSNIDFTDEKMLYSNYYPVVLKNYFSEVSFININNIDSLYGVIDYILFTSIKNPLIYKEIFKYLLKNFDVAGEFSCNELFNYLSEHYILKGLAPWYNNNFKIRLKDYIKSMSKVLVKNKFEQYTFYDVFDNEIIIPDNVEKYKLIIFWEPHCPYCEKYIKELKQVKNTSLLVYMVGIVKNKQEWLKVIKEYQIENFINLYDKKGFNDFVEDLFLYQTPQSFLLDKSNTIIAKNIKINELEKYIE